MMWTELRALEEAPPIEAAWKQTIAEDSEFIWLVSRDDGTPIMVAGLYRVNVTLPIRIIWVAPYPSLRPFDLRGLKKLFQKIVEKIPSIVAEVDMSNAKAVALAKHIGLRHLRTNEFNRGTFAWPF